MSEAEASETDERPRRLDTAVRRAISRLQRERVEGDTSASRAALAQLRQAVDEEPGETPGAWERVMETIPPSYCGTTDEPSDGEWAVHLALTFYAVHQQGNTRPMHESGVSFGAACGRLVRGRTASTKGRYDAALTATSFTAQRYHLRSLIGLMSTDGITLDYGRFAQDLFLLQKPGYRAGIIRRWGRDFFHAYTLTPRTEDASAETELADTD